MGVVWFFVLVVFCVCFCFGWLPTISRCRSFLPDLMTVRAVIFEFHSVCRTTCELDYSGLHERFFLDPQVLGYFGNSGALVQVM